MTLLRSVIVKWSRSPLALPSLRQGADALRAIAFPKVYHGSHEAFAPPA